MAEKYAVSSEQCQFSDIDGVDLGLNGENFEYRKLNEEQTNACKACFDYFDKDGNGKIDIKEIDKAMRTLGLNPTKGDLKKIIKQYDDNRNGCLDWEEFQQLMTVSWKSVKQTELEMVIAFRTIDKNKDGFITKEELAKVLTSFGEEMRPEEAQEIIDLADADNDGRINYKEFVHMMCDGPLSTFS